MMEVYYSHVGEHGRGRDIGRAQRGCEQTELYHVGREGRGGERGERTEDRGLGEGEGGGEPHR